MSRSGTDWTCAVTARQLGPALVIFRAARTSIRAARLDVKKEPQPCEYLRAARYTRSACSRQPARRSLGEAAKLACRLLQRAGATLSPVLEVKTRAVRHISAGAFACIL